VLEFLTSNAIYVVLIISLVVWLGIYVYLRRIEKKVRVLEEHLSKKG
jgi:hypothetical protein